MVQAIDAVRTRITVIECQGSGGHPLAVILRENLCQREGGPIDLYLFMVPHAGLFTAGQLTMSANKCFVLVDFAILLQTGSVHAKTPEAVISSVISTSIMPA